MKIQSNILLRIFSTVAIAAAVALIAFSILSRMRAEFERVRMYDEVSDKTRALNVLVASLRDGVDQSDERQARTTLLSLDGLLRKMTSRIPREEALIRQLQRENEELGFVLEQMLQSGQGTDGVEKERRNILASQVWMKVRFISDDTNRLMDISQHRIAEAQKSAGTAVIALILVLAVTNGTIFFLYGRRMQRAQAALRQSQEQYRVTLSSIGDAVIAADSAGMVRFLNPVASELTGWKLGEATNVPIRRVFPIINEKTGKPAEDIIGRVLRDGHVVNLANHTALVARDGRRVPIEDSAAPIVDDGGNISGVVLVFHDVTEKRLAQETLRESEERLRTFIEHAPASLAMFDGGMRYLCCSRRWVAGYIPEEIDPIGMTPYDIFPDMPEHWKEVHRRGMAGEVVRCEDDRFVLHDGSTQRVRWEVRPWLNAEGGVSGVVAFIEDITEAKKQENELQQLNRTLRALSNTNQAAVSALDESDFLQAVCRIIVEDCEHPMVWIGFAEDGEDRRVRPIALAGVEEGYLESAKITWADTALGLGPTGTAIRTGTPDVCENIWTEERMKPWREEAAKRGYASSVALPLRIEGRTLGALTIYSREPDSFHDDEVKLLAELADDLSYGLTLLRLRQAHERAEADLRVSRGRLDLALRSAGMGTWHWDMIENRRHFDEQAFQLLGLDPGSYAGESEKIFEIMHPDDRETTRGALARAVEQDVQYESDYRVIWPDGSIHYIAARGKVVRDENGRPVRVNGLIWDISARKLAEQKLFETNQRLEALMNALPVGVSFSDDATCSSIRGNPAVMAQFETKRGENLSASAADADAPGRRVRYFRRGREIGDGELPLQRAVTENREIAPMELEVRLPSGHRWFSEVSGAPVRDADGRVIAGVAVSLDITSRKQMEKELRKSRDELELRVRERTAELVRAGEDLERQAALLNLARDAIFVLGLDHTVEFWNDGAEELYGFTVKETMGRPAHDLLRTVFPEPLDRIVERMMESGRWEGELRQVTSAGKEILIESRWALERGPDGKPTGYLEINRDVTARKRAEEALRANMARLELVNAELQEFAHVASHDLQEPLRKILTFCDLAKKRSGAALDGTGLEYLDRVINSAGRMRQLLRDLLEFSRVATRLEPFKKIELARIAREAADIFEAKVRKTGCRIEIDDIPAIEADETQMLRLFQNLIGNALKFRGDGQPGIWIRGWHDAQGACEITVEDNGIGFDSRFAELIFKPFQRLHGRDEYEGTGMGLAICRKIVERHGGSIRAEGRPGVGAKFFIRLPEKQTELGGASGARQEL